MSVIQNLYQIFKIPSTDLVAHNCSMEYSRLQGIKDGNIVSIGDNLVFQQLRYFHGDYRDHHELFNYVSNFRKRAHEYKKAGDYKKAHVLENRINEVLFVKDIVNVVINGKKSDFNKFRTKGFDFNGAHYVYLCSGSGQIRRNTATFVNEEYHDRLVKILNCGLDEKTSEFVLAKYSAYFALSFSSILWVRTPRVCVVKDFYRTLAQEPVDFIYHDKNDNDKAKIEERKMDLELNCADGQGIIDPYFAELWSQDMDLSYTPCSFVARSCFIKGNLVAFDFKEYAHKNGINTIRDKWGKEYNVDDIDVLISESQFKTHKYYSSWQEYCDYAKRGNIHWGVARYTKRRDAENVLANYQYIQSLDLSTEDIQQLITPIVDWIQKVCSGDLAYALLYSFGSKSDSVEYKEIYGSAQTTATKALVKNAAFLQDSYVQRKIYKNIIESIDHAKIGKIWIRGNYQFMIADPMAQVQAALGLEPTGIVGKNQVYSNFWRKRFKPGQSPVVDACRSPMIDLHEHNPVTVVTDNPEADYWFRFIYSGIIYNTYDTSCYRHSDSDYDGDICLTTDNPYFIKGSHKDHNIITYEKGLAVPAKMTTSKITSTVMKGFGTGVGGFSNTATILYAMAAMFNKPGQEEQYNEIMTRIKLLREIVGQEIDRIKGADKPSLPSEWKKFESITEDDTPEERLSKMRRNAMVVSKKPYFFRYLYPELNKKFKQFEASYNQISRDMFGIKFKKLFLKPQKTEEEQMLIRRYQKYSPLITSACTMNKLCKAIENVEFDIKFNKSSSSDHGGASKKNPVVSCLPTFEDIYSASFSQEKLLIVKKLYQSYSGRKKVVHLKALLANETPLEEDDVLIQTRSAVYDSVIDSIQQELSQSGISNEEFLFYCSRLSAQYSQFNWAFAWDILDTAIIDLIPQGHSVIPVRDSFGSIEYLGEHYKLKDISNVDELAIQKLYDAIFGNPNCSLDDSYVQEALAASELETSANEDSLINSIFKNTTNTTKEEEETHE